MTTDPTGPLAFARIAAQRDFPVEEVVTALVEDFGMTPEDARAGYSQALRERQELDITDAHDEIDAQRP